MNTNDNIFGDSHRDSSEPTLYWSKYTAKQLCRLGGAYTRCLELALDRFRPMAMA